MKDEKIKYLVTPGFDDKSKTVVMEIPSDVFDDYDYLTCFGMVYHFATMIYDSFVINRVRHRTPEEIGGPLALYGTFAILIKWGENDISIPKDNICQNGKD
jgi:hypothetical protein